MCHRAFKWEQAFTQGRAPEGSDVTSVGADWG